MIAKVVKAVEKMSSELECHLIGSVNVLCTCQRILNKWTFEYEENFKFRVLRREQ